MQWHAKRMEEVFQELSVRQETGLDGGEAARRLVEHGPNELRAAKGRTALMMFLSQFADFMVLVLLAAALVSGVILHELADSLIILIVVILNAVLGVVQENRAEHSLAAIKKLASPHAKVRRDGQMHILPAGELVPGDVVVLETGDYVPADIRLYNSVNLKTQESALTGESTPVEKEAGEAEESAGLGDRHNMAFSGSLVTYGRGEGVAVETGMNTQLGRIAGMLEKEEGVKTPLQRRLAGMSKGLAFAAMGVCALVFLVGVLYGKDPLSMFMTAISLAVAAIPEGMLAIVTIVLAIGVQKMIAQNAIIRRLPAVETLGSATVVCSDKTGTLTMNRMTVVAASAPFEAGDVQSFRRQSAAVLMGTAMMMCNDGQLGKADGKEVFLGDPTETALLDYAHAMGYDKKRLEAKMPRVDEVPFDSDRKRMATVHREGNKFRVFAKGGLDEILEICTHIQDGAVRPITQEDIQRIQATAGEMAEAALRVLAFAMGEVRELSQGDKQADYEQNLVFLGMAGMIDPPRLTAKEAVAQCLKAGIKPVMITGDHKVTAAAIARDLGILGRGDRVVTGLELSHMDDDRLREEVRNIAVYARVSPEHKLRIIKAWQSWGDVVAMTGDGVNDAPALKRADIGVAMGITGTEVSKEASAMILTDDNFATIVAAVSQGRTIYNNILKAIQFLLSCNLGEILTIFVATLLNWDSPLLPIHILWINLITDTFPALALGMEPAERDVMRRPPRDPKAPIFEKPLLLRMGYQGTMIGALTLCAFLIGKAASLDLGETMAFLVLSGSQIAHSFNLRSNTYSVFSKGEGNKWLFYAAGASLFLMLSVALVPFLQPIFHIVPMDLIHWLITIGLILAPILVVEIFKALGLTGEKPQRKH